MSSVGLPAVYKLTASTTLSSPSTTIVVNATFNITKSYLVKFRGKQAVANGQIYMFIHTDTTATNYYTQRFYLNNAAVSASRVNLSLIGDAINGDYNVIDVLVEFDLSGRLRARTLQSNNQVPASCEGKFSEVLSVNTFSTISSITFTNSQVNGHAATSKVEIYEMG